MGSNPEVVATGSIDVMGPKRLRVISNAEILDRAWRVCPLGSTACNFDRGGTVISPLSEAGTVDVDMACSDGPRCVADSLALQAGLNRLRASAGPTAVTEQKPATA